MSVSLDRPYCTLEDVQKETKNSGSENDDWYHTQINLASRFIEEHCHRDFLFHDHSTTPLTVERKQVLDDQVFFLWPIITLTDVWVWSEHTEEATDNDKLDDEDFYFEVGEGILHSEYGTFGPHPFRANLKVKGTFGYALDVDNPTTAPPPAVPAAVRRACALIAANLSNENRKENVALDGSRSEILDSSLPSEAITLLRRWVASSEVAL